MERKSVIRGLHDLRRYLEDKEWSADFEEPYVEIVIAAEEMLKEQEAVKPKSKSRHGEYPQIVHRCGKCNEILYRYYKFCPSCGKAVKWK